MERKQDRGRGEETPPAQMKRRSSVNKSAGSAFVLGIAMGTAIGVATGNLAVWIGIGVAIGAALASAARLTGRQP